MFIKGNKNKDVNDYIQWANEQPVFTDTSYKDLKVEFKYLPSELGLVKYLGNKLSQSAIDSFYKTGNDTLNFIRLFIQRNYEMASNEARKMNLDQQDTKDKGLGLCQVFIGDQIVRDPIIEMTDTKGIARQVLIPVSPWQIQNHKDLIIMHKVRPVRTIKININKLIPNKKPKLSI